MVQKNTSAHMQNLQIYDLWLNDVQEAFLLHTSKHIKKHYTVVKFFIPQSGKQ